MSIVDTANGTGTIIFHGPEPVVLPNGKAAYAFISDQDIPLQQQSEYKFELQGVVGDQNRQRSVSVKRLPVAGFTQVYKKSRFRPCLLGNLCLCLESILNLNVVPALIFIAHAG